jgi:hypothetical protein
MVSSNDEWNAPMSRRVMRGFDPARLSRARESKGISRADLAPCLRHSFRLSRFVGSRRSMFRSTAVAMLAVSRFRSALRCARMLLLRCVSCPAGTAVAPTAFSCFITRRSIFFGSRVSIMRIAWAGALAAGSCSPPSVTCARRCGLSGGSWRFGVWFRLSVPSRVRVCARGRRGRGRWTAAARPSGAGRSPRVRRVLCWRSAARIRILRSSEGLAPDE